MNAAELRVASTAYLKNPAYCPKCGGGSFDCQPIEAADGRAYQECQCTICDTVWHDGYTFDSVAIEHDGELTQFVYAKTCPKAAAPELLAACESIAGFSDGEADMDRIMSFRWSAVEQARAAIAAAKT
jgi:hypothetical protein